MSTSNFESPRMPADRARNAMIDDLLASVIARCTVAPPWAAEWQETLRDPTPRSRIASYKKIRESGDMSENIITFLIWRPFECLTEEELEDDFEAFEFSKLLLMKRHGFGELAERKPWMYPDIRQYAALCPSDWQQRLTKTLREHGEGQAAEIYAADPLAVEETYHHGWYELFNLARGSEGELVPGLWIIDFVDEVLAQIEVQSEADELLVRVSVVDGTHMVQLAPPPIEPAPDTMILLPMGVNLRGVMQVFDEVNEMTWQTTQQEAGLMPGFRISGTYGEYLVDLEVAAVLCP